MFIIIGLGLFIVLSIVGLNIAKYYSYEHFDHVRLIDNGKHSYGKVRIDTKTKLYEYHGKSGRWKHMTKRHKEDFEKNKADGKFEFHL